MTRDILRFPIALLGGIAFAALLFITIQWLLLRPSTPNTSAHSALMLERVQLHEPAQPKPQKAQTPPPQTRPPAPTTPTTLSVAAADSADILGQAIALNSTGDFALGLPQHGTQTWGAVDSSLVILNRREPVYPPTAARRGIEGWVKLQFNVDLEGRVQGAKVVEAQPPNLFNRAALQAVQQWRFKPRQVNGKTIATSVVQTLSFRLDT